MAILETIAFVSDVKKSKQGNFFVTFSYLTGRSVNGKKEKQFINCTSSKKVKAVSEEIFKSQSVVDGKTVHKLSGKLVKIKIRDPYFYIYENNDNASLQSNGLLIELNQHARSIAATV
ncbi:MAG: hypothetical protein MK175_20095 [Pseudoalteromonas sp.]|uniref:hypothetical protein n=1 Tax=Pseudoalteromonas sp. TaxID=53249 RepID=UPI0025F506AF|nr:hypothetical protein [Pseudoalteromonas sp.]MCH2089490.1 hypothetical protein [Pseudoalteromonas sp.]